MTAETFLNGKVALLAGDMLAVLSTLAENSIDSCVTDPPYHLTSIVQRFANANPETERFAANNDHKGFRRLSAGFMGKKWDGGDVAFKPETWREVWRVLKPGAHLLAFGGTRTFHRMACAIEDAGFEIRDCIMWVYGSGFPKSHNVAISLDKMAGEPPRDKAFNMKGRGDRAEEFDDNGREWPPPYKPATDAAREWSGWGTALKPACEPIVVARKPLSEPTVAANVLRWGTGALNVDGCKQEQINSIIQQSGRYEATTELKSNGRWPANLVHDGSDEVVAGFPQTTVPGRFPKSTGGIGTASGIYGKAEGRSQIERSVDDGSGSAARFFYTAKADQDDRLGSKHPTVKPVDLMQWLVRLVTPKGGLVLDPFAGTGTTGEAAWREGCNATLIEREEDSIADIRRRMALALAGPDERKRAIVAARGQLDLDPGPLFASLAW